MNVSNLHYVGGLDRIPDGWENNLAITYQQYYELLNLALPSLGVFGKLIGEILEGIVKDNEGRECEVTQFHLEQPPPIGIEAYIERITKYSMCSAEVYILAVIYIDKYHREKGNTCLNEGNIHK